MSNPDSFNATGRKDSRSSCEAGHHSRRAILTSLPRTERDVVHRVAAEGAVGVEDVPFDEQGALFGFWEVVEVVPIFFGDGVEFRIGEVLGCWFCR